MGSVRRFRSQIPLLVIVSMLFLSRASLADHYKVPSGSMLPTIEIGDRVVVDKRAFGVRVPLTHRYLWRYQRPAAGDVVVVDSPVEDKVLLKRVVATPGQRVEVRRGWLRIDGEWQMLEQDGARIVEALGAKRHAISLDKGGGTTLEETVLPEDCYLLVGDNRGDSLDGRVFGCVSAGAVLGRALGVYHSSDNGWVWRPL
jgi:signal peptidase I